jgi:hypothetical protein
MVGYLFQKILIILENRGYVPEWVPWNVFENHGYENPKRCPDNHRGVYFLFLITAVEGQVQIIYNLIQFNLI